MKVFAQSSRCPSQVLFAFDDVADTHVEKVRWAVAYSTRAGCVRLTDRLSARIGETKWKEIEKEFITSLDFGLTDPDALEFLAGLPASKVHIANPGVVDKQGLLPAKAYHPKLYLFDSMKETGYVVGSANLTNNALMTNTEVVVSGKENLESGCWSGVWSELLFNTAPYTNALLNNYKRRWSGLKRHTVEPDSSPIEPVVRKPHDKPVFGEEVTNGNVSPMAFNHFWMEVTTLSGGSSNQLELPRGANRFFEFNYNDYENTTSVVDIGSPILTYKDKVWDDKPLRWHPSNRMERFNLPTIIQGGFDYQNTAILFRRHKYGFELNILPWDDEEAVAWRAASDILKKVFRLGQGSERICGLF